MPSERRTHFLVWVAAILCAIIATCVIIAGVVTFIGYLVIHPRIPDVSVVGASLDTFRFDSAGVLVIQATIVMRAHNGNEKAHARFYNWHFIFSLDEMDLAHLQVADPFDVRKNSSVDFNYVAQSTPVTLDPDTEDWVDGSLKRDRIAFNLKGSSRARWRVGALGSVKFTCNLDCQLRFHRNGTYIPSRCTSQAK
ncbi:hypothetical protein SLA2020_457580 [Shorea laevis]